jgi:hypothetical protein
MIKITVSKYLNTKSETEYQAFFNSVPICKNSTDENFVQSYANTVYHQQQRAVLTHYNGITDKETIIEAKGYTQKEMKKFKTEQNIS